MLKRTKEYFKERNNEIVKSTKENVVVSQKLFSSGKVGGEGRGGDNNLIEIWCCSIYYVCIMYLIFILTVKKKKYYKPAPPIQTSPAHREAQPGFVVPNYISLYISCFFKCYIMSHSIYYYLYTRLSIYLTIIHICISRY